MKAKYVNPFTDFGFKKIFGEEASKHLLMDFLNTLLPKKARIKTLSFKNTEHLGQTEIDRKAIYDIYCENETGEKFIVELQKAKQNFFKDRTVYYATFPIQEQAEKGEWDYNLQAVYCVGILDFRFDDYKNSPKKSEVMHTIKLKNQHGKVFYSKLTYIYLEMPNFNKKENELKTHLDKWLYFIKNLEDFQSIPIIFGEDIFIDAFEKAELANLSTIERSNYENNLKGYRDMKNTFDTAKSDGRMEGLMEGKIEGKIEGRIEGKMEEKFAIAKALKEKGVAIDIISVTTGLSESEIEKL